MNKPPRGLGRGLDALLPPVPAQPVPAQPAAATPAAAAPGAGAAPVAAPNTTGAGSSFSCAIEKLTPQRGQPRQYFNPTALEELAQSIREHGVIEPLLVRRIGQDRFEIIAGERRWRASQKAGLKEVPVVVREASNQNAFELALIENVQREDLNALELAEGLQRLIDEYQYTQETLAKRIGKDRSTLANALRLLKLPDSVRKLVTKGDLSEGHARALLGAPDDATMTRLAESSLRNKWNVRQLEGEVRSLKSRKSGAEGSKSESRSAATRDLENRLARKYGARCQVRDRKGKGELVMHYGSLDDLDRILDLLL